MARDEYWEGPLKRSNDNVGTITTQVNTWYVNYGLSNRLNVIGAVPYVWTRASKGVLHGIDGWQDLTLAAKYAFVDRGVSGFRAIGAASAGIPLSAGNWRMIVLSGPTQIAVPTPGQATSLDYQAELTAIKNAQSRITASPCIGAARASIAAFGNGRIRGPSRIDRSITCRLRRIWPSFTCRTSLQLRHVVCAEWCALARTIREPEPVRRHQGRQPDHAQTVGPWASIPT